MRPLSVREVLASVAASHEPDCECVTCRGAAGDERAIEEVLHAVAAIEYAETPAGRYAWELVRCTNPDCRHEHTRHANGRLALACHHCSAAMDVLPLQSVEEAAQGFGPSAMREALDWAFHSELERAQRLDAEPAEKARHIGRAEAFSECLDLLAAATRRRAINGSGVISDRLARSLGRDDELTVGDRLRTPVEASA